MAETSLTEPGLEARLEGSRRELTAYCYRMLGSPFEAEDAVQDTFIRAWRAYDRFEGRAALRSWLYRIATNVCLDMLGGRERRARPMDLGPAQETGAREPELRPEASYVEPIPDALVAPGADPAEIAATRDSVRLALVAALQHLPPRQRAALILCEVLRWKASEVAELLDTSVASVNSALQRARATLDGTSSRPRSRWRSTTSTGSCWPATSTAFEAYDMDALTSLIREDATQSMPPYDLWLARPRRHPHVVVRAGHRLPGLEGHPYRRGQRRRRRSASTSRARAARATSPGRSRCSRPRTAGSTSSRSSSTRSGSSRSSGFRPASKLLALGLVPEAPGRGRDEGQEDEGEPCQVDELTQGG